MTLDELKDKHWDAEVRGTSNWKVSIQYAISVLEELDEEIILLKDSVKLRNKIESLRKLM